MLLITVGKSTPEDVAAMFLAMPPQENEPFLAWAKRNDVGLEGDPMQAFVLLNKAVVLSGVRFGQVH